jgi:hypothetical protein
MFDDSGRGEHDQGLKSPWGRSRISAILMSCTSPRIPPPTNSSTATHSRSSLA